MELPEYLLTRSRLIDRALDEYLPPAATYPSVLHAAMRYSVFAGGKRLRPVLTIAAAEAVGASATAVLPAACGLELIHTYSLIHDDLPAMDNDDYRRGQLTSHKVYGEAVAILTGDALLTLGLELIARSADDGQCSPEAVLKVLRETAIAIGTLGLVGGQAADIIHTGQAVSPEVLDYIHSHKTGALLTAAVRAGAMLGRADAGQLEALTNYTTHLGLCYQIVDDILDAVGNAAKMGKQVGKDSQQGKNTFPGHYGLEAAKAMAASSARAATASLAGFGGDARVLADLVAYIATRDH